VFILKFLFLKEVRMTILFKIMIVVFTLLALPGWAFPDRPVKIIVSLPAGSGPDAMARKLAEVLADKWQQPVVIENRPGGSAIIALNQLQREAADGYTIAMFTQGDYVAFPILFGLDRTLSTIDLLTPFFTADMVLFTSPKIKNLDDLKIKLKSNPRYGSSGIGSIQHINAAEFASLYVNNAIHVPYREFSNWKIDTSNELVTFGFTSFASGNAMYQAGNIHYIAIASNNRDSRFSNVPTVKELTEKNLVSQSWLAFFTKKGMPESVRVKLKNDIQRAIADQKMNSFITGSFYIPLNNVDSKKFSEQIEKEVIIYKNNIELYNINLQR
jgi:tripartite-type tricarboxylate transporter receptor subunit TctC